MPIFESNGKKYNVQDAHIENFKAEHPDATAVLEREGKKFRVKVGDYGKFMQGVSAAPPAPKAEEINPTGDKSGYTFTAEELGMPDNTYKAESTSVARLPEIKPIGGASRVSMGAEEDANVQPLTTFGEGVKQGAESMYEGGRYAAGEIGRIYGDSQRAYADALEYLDKQGDNFDASSFDKSQAIEDERNERFQLAMEDYRKEMAKRRKERENLGFFATIAHKWNDPERPNSRDYIGSHYEDMRAGKAIVAVDEALKEANGDIEKAREILENKANEESWGDRVTREAGEVLSQMKPVEGAAWWGQMVPQVMGQAAAIGANFIPGVGQPLSRALAIASTTALTASSAGSAMQEARAAGATDGEIMSAGALQAGIEYFSEKIPLERLLGKTGSAAFRKGFKGETGNIVGEEVERLLEEGNKRLGGKLLSGQTAKEFVKNVGVEAASEFIAEGAGTFVPMIYEDKENYPTLGEAFENAIEGAKAGAVMGGFLGGGTQVLTNRANNARRKKQGNVMLAETKDGVVEVLQTNDGNVEVLNADGEVSWIPASELVKRYTYTYNEWENNEVDARINHAYQEGYEAADEQKGAVKKAYDMERERVLNTFGEEVVQRLDDDPIGALMELNEVDRQEAIAYVNARTAYEGMIDRISDDIDERIKASDKEIESHANRQDGAIHPAVMRGVNGAAPKRVYIVGGNVATLEDGTIDKANSSSMIIVRDAETGEVSAASADDLESLEAVIDTEAEKRTVAELIANEYAGQQAVIIEGENGEVEGENEVQPEVAPVVEQTQPVAQTALERVPKAENGEPVYEQADAETAWDAIMEQTNDEELATQVVEGMIADKEAALKKLENSKVREGVTVAEKIAAAQQRKAAIEKAKADLAKWQEIAAVKAKRETAAVESAPVVEETQAPVDESAPVADNTPQSQSDSSPTLVEQPTPQATNEMQEADLENAEKGQKAVEPGGENKPKVRGRKQVEKAVEKMRKADAEGNAIEAMNQAGGNAPGSGGVVESVNRRRIEANLMQMRAADGDAIMSAEQKSEAVLAAAGRIKKFADELTHDELAEVEAMEAKYRPAEKYVDPNELNDVIIPRPADNDDVDAIVLPYVTARGKDGKIRDYYVDMDIEVGKHLINGNETYLPLEMLYDEYGEKFLKEHNIDPAVLPTPGRYRLLGYNNRGFYIDFNGGEYFIFGFGVPEYVQQLIEQGNYRGLMTDAPAVESAQKAESGTNGNVQQAENVAEGGNAPGQSGVVGNNKATQKSKGNAPKRVNVESLMGALKQNGEAKLSDHVEQTTNPSGNKLVTDERYNELKERMKKKLKGQMNIGVDPEILAIGTEMAVYHIEKGARRFADFAKGMIADLGDAIRPYLKAFYNGARELPEIEEAGFTKDMTPYEEVKTFDVANFDKQAVDAMATAETVTRETEVAKDVEAVKAPKKRESAEGKKLRKATQDDLEGNPVVYYKGEKHRILMLVHRGEQTSSGNFTKPVIERVYLENMQSVKADDLYVEDTRENVGESGDNSVPSQQTPVNNLNENNDGREENTATDNSGAQPGREELPDTEQVGAGAPIQDTARNSKRKRRNAGVGSSELGNGPQYDVNRNYTNEEIEEIVSSVTDIVDGKVVITGEVTDDIKAIVRGYESGGIAKKGRGILDEYYTDGKIVDAVNLLIAPYFSGSTPIRVLEPSVGIGNFIQAVNNIPTSEVVAFEINETTARIAKILYPDVDVNLRSFETEFIDESGNKKPMPQKYSLVIGNPPYGSHRGLYKGLGEESKIARYEDYFVKRSLDVLDEGGLLAMVLPSSWMDRHTKFGGYTIERAYRLPSGAFEATQVGTDIVILKKDSSVPVTEHAPYFEQFPERVLGEVKQRKGRYGRLEEYVEGDIDAAIETIKKENAEQVADLLDIEKNNDALNDIESAVDETGSLEKAVAIVKDAQESEKADKKPAKKPSGKQGKYKVELNRGVETVPTSAQFTHEFSEGEVEAFADTDYEGALSNPAKHRRYANYIGGQAIHDFYYAEGDIYSKLAQLELEKDYIVENYGVEQYEKQKALLESVLPKQKSLEEITISPNTTFVKNLNILTEGGRVSLKDMFVDFLRKLPHQAFGESSPWEVIAYINNEQVHGTDKSRNQRIRERRKRVANDLFNKFLSEELSDNAKKQVVAAFNREYNSTYRPDYSKVPMFSTINRDFKGKPLKLTSVQLAGIGRMTVKGVGVLAHEVGFGKTLSGILAMHEAMTRGFAKKPLIVVPNDNILKQWVETIGEVLPNATINVLGNLGAGYDLTDFKVNDGEFTIITYEGLKAMSFSDGTYDHLAARFSYITEDLNKHQSERDIQKEIEKKKELKGKMKRGTKPTYLFEDFGFDWLTVDEVHNANHIVSKVRLDKSVASDFRSQSQRTSDLGLKTWLAAQYIQEENNGRNVLLLSATPFTNKPLEYYSILSLVGNDMLERKGFFNVDQFFATFMEADNELEIGANGRPMQKTNVRRFRNNGLFQQLLSEFIDIKGEEDNPELVRPERLNKEYKIAQNELTAEAMAAAQELLSDNDTVLQGIGHARAAAFSPYATSLLGRQPKNHVEFVRNSPKIDATIKMIEQNIKDRPDAGQIIYSEVGVEYFPLIRDYLVKESGLKPSEVRIITGATSNNERVNIQTAFNNGEVKVVIGSPAIKEGLNLQGNTTDMYILSLPWNFTQLRQIEGRGWRQGNRWENIRINYMLTNDSVDVFMLQRLQLKQGLYNEAMKSGAESLDVSDIDTAELKTALITDPAVRAEIVTVQERAKLQQEKTQIEADLSFVMRKYEAYNKLVEKLENAKRTIKMYREWAQRGDEYWAQRAEREEAQLPSLENEIEEEKQNLLKKGVNVDDIVRQTEQAQSAIAAIQEKIDNLKEFQEELTRKFREESEAKAKEQGDLVSTYIKERKAENKGGFYRIRPEKTETKVTEEDAEDGVLYRSAEEDDVLYRLTGEKGAAALDDMEGVTTRMDDLVLAKAMEARGYEPWVIEVATKWRRIKNGQWRYDLGKKKRRDNDRELYNSDLTTEEKRAIQKYIESLPENYASKHPLAFENNGYIYIFNTSRIQYEDNRDDKHDGFYILRKIDLNNISNERRSKIERLTGENLRHADRVDGEFRSEQDNNQSSGSASSGTPTAVQTDGVDIETDGNSQSRRRRDTGAGFENEREVEFDREGAGPLTDREVVMESDPYSKVLGKPRYYGKRQREFVARQRRRMAEKARQVAEKLNLNNVEVLESTEDLTGKKATSKGWFDPRTGKITVVVPNHGSTGDIVETVLHEAVAHYGLRKLFGENFKNFLDNVYRNVTPEIRAEITELAKKHGWDFHTATEEYLASLAENMNFEKVNPSLWSNIKSFFMKMLAKVGITLNEPLGDNELRYILWRSHQNLVNPGWFNVFGQAEDIAKQYELGVGNYASGEVKTENGEVAAEDEIRFREGGAPGSAREEYERKVRRPNKSGSVGATENVARRAQEAYQDSMLALKILQDVVARETGNEVKDNENAYIAENRMSSSNKAMVEIYERDFFMPLMDKINALIKEGVEYDDIIRYLHAKHGLERNEYMRRKQAEEAARRELGEEPAMPNEGDVDYEAKVNAKAAWRANLAELTESYVKKFAKRDYSGLTALTESANAKDAEAAAQQMVDEFENDHDTTPLWKAVNKATKETLRREFVGGLIDRATYDTVSTMFDFYIPLRGWDENVAANEYEYFTNNNTPVFTPAIKTMRGRPSLSDDPIATIGYMAGSAIARANRNLMKQKFLNFVMNNPTSLATVSEQWYTMDYGTNEWVPNNPAIPEDATPEQVVEIVEAHEANMRALEKAGKATRERSGLKIGLHATKQEEQQHVVRVMRNGKEYAVYINGNPRAAQALNGMTNPDSSLSKEWTRALAVKNFMARAFTSRNPAFIISNSVRDVIWAGTAVAAKEDAEYTKQYTKNVTGVLAKFKLPRLLRKFQNGTLDMNDEIERYFDEFLRNGGETGFTQVLTVEDYKKNIARFTKEAKNGTSIPKKAWRGLWNGIEFLNRSAEDITRFTVYMTSRQMGRSIERSVYDAKEITVNFNKKGSGEMGARYWNFAYIFFNATIQSLANFGKLVYRHPGKMAAALGTFGMMGFLMPVINAALMALGDDDDEENYWNLPEWVRRNNIVLFVPWTEKGFITIPLPHELRPFYGMGENAMSALLGKQSTEDAIKKSLVGFTGMLPIDFTANGGDVVVNAMPTILQPLAQVRANVTHFGTPIYKDNDFNKRYPSWTKAYKGTNSTLVAATKWLNELGGGNNVDSGGLLDWNPAVIEHLFESYLGGMGKTFNKAATTVSMLWDEDARIARNIPVASSFYQESDERTAGSQLNREYFDALEEMEGFQHRMSGYQKQITKGNAEYEKLFEDLVNSDEFMRYSIIKDYSNAISELDQVLKNNGPTEEEAQEIEGVIQELKNEMLDELEKLQAEE